MFNKNFADDGIRTADLFANRFANWATTTAHLSHLYLHHSPYLNFPPYHHHLNSKLSLSLYL